VVRGSAAERRSKAADGRAGAAMRVGEVEQGLQMRACRRALGERELRVRMARRAPQGALGEAGGQARPGARKSNGRALERVEVCRGEAVVGRLRGRGRSPRTDATTLLARTDATTLLATGKDGRDETGTPAGLRSGDMPRACHR
jgi:hypothetical protein